MPLPLTYINNGKMVYDTASFLLDSPTSNDILLSSVTGKRCRVVNMFAGEDVCSEEPFDPPVELYQTTLMETDMTW